MLDYYRFKTVSDLFMKGQTEQARLELAELQRRYVALCDENTTFKIQVQEYEDILYLARNLSYDRGFYWLTTGSIRQGPFCPHCYDRDGLLMRLSGEPGRYDCTQCRYEFDQPPSTPVRHEMVATGGGSPAGKAEPPRSIHGRRATVIPFSRE